jgi:adhesin transport system outer membrane protein
MRHARLQRDAFESLDKAWAARTITSDRAAALLRQVSADRKAIAAYNKEYELGQRSLIDLLNAENQLYNGLVSLESTRDVAVFADYQLLAAMGQLLMFLKTPESSDAMPLESIPLGAFRLFPAKLPPILLTLPPTGSEPLNVNGALIPDGSPNNGAPLSVRADVTTFGDRWPHLAGWPDTANVLAQLRQLAPQAAPGAPVAGEAGGAPAIMSFAPEMLQVWPHPVSMNKPN